MKATIALIALASVSTTLAGDRFGDPPNETHAWAVHDMHRPLPPKVEVPANGVPSDAIVLFDGTAESVARNWCNDRGEPTGWKVVDGAFCCVPRTGGAQTREKFGDVQLHLEWMSPEGDDPHFAMGRGNSGVILMGRYEIQVIDAHDQYAGSDAAEYTYADGLAGAVYGQNPPQVNAARPRGLWQSYDIVFHPPRWDGATLTDRGSFTVFHNGVLVQDAQPLEGGTTWRRRIGFSRHAPEAPLKLQDHGNPVPYRNIWIRRIAPCHVVVDVTAQRERTAAELFARLDPQAEVTASNLVRAVEVLYYSRRPEYLAAERRLRTAYAAWLERTPLADVRRADVFPVWDVYDVFVRTGDDLGKGALVSRLNEIMDKKGWRPKW